VAPKILEEIRMSKITEKIESFLKEAKITKVDADKVEKNLQKLDLAGKIVDVTWSDRLLKKKSVKNYLQVKISKWPEHKKVIAAVEKLGYKFVDTNRSYNMVIFEK